MSSEYYQLIVREAYKQILGRQPDDSGLMNYSQLLLTGRIDKNTLHKILQESDEYKSKNLFLKVSEKEFDGDIAYCQSVYSGDIWQATQNVKLFKQFNPSIICIIVYDDTVDKFYVDNITQAGALVFHYSWEDNLPKQRNNALKEARLFNAKWIISSDPDESFNSQFVKDIKHIIGTAIYYGKDLIQINCHNYDLDKHRDSPKDYYKDLVFELKPEVKFIGHGNLKIWHEGIYGLNNGIRLESKYFYTHTFSRNQLLEHWTRDLFICGSGPSLGTENPTWVELKKITDELNIKTWTEMREYLNKGNVSNELKKFMLIHKDDNKKDGDQQVRAMFKYYYELLHPKENVTGYRNLSVFGDLE